MFNQLRNAFNGTNGMFYDRFREPYHVLLRRLDALHPAPDAAVAYGLAQMREYLTGTEAVLHSLFFPHRTSPAIFGRAALGSVSIANGERLFSLLLVGMIRQCNLSGPEEGDMFCDLATRIMPKEHVPLATRLSTAMRITDMDECEGKLHDVLQESLPPFGGFDLMRVRSAVLPVCIWLNTTQRSKVQTLELALLRERFSVVSKMRAGPP